MREKERGRSVWEQESLPTSSFMVLVLCPSCSAEINQAGLTRLAHLQLLFDTLSFPCYKVCLAYLSPVSSTWHTAHQIWKTEITAKQCTHCDILIMPCWSKMESIAKSAHCSKMGPTEESLYTVAIKQSIIKRAPVLWWSRVHIKLLESVAKSAPLLCWSIMGLWKRDPQCNVKNQERSKVRLDAVLM